MQNADDVLLALAPQGNPRAPGLEHGPEDIGIGIIDADRDHLGAMDHHVPHGQIAQIVAPTAGTDYANRLVQFCSLIDNKTHPKVTFVFASHDHRLFVYPTPSNPNGPFTRSVPATANPTFIVTGGAGAPLTGCKGTSGPAGSYFHYLSVAVDGANVTATVVPLYSTTPCSAGAVSAQSLGGGR